VLTSVTSARGHQLLEFGSVRQLELFQPLAARTPGEGGAGSVMGALHWSVSAPIGAPVDQYNGVRGNAMIIRPKSASNFTMTPTSTPQAFSTA
jgi:hypothetical protein